MSFRLKTVLGIALIEAVLLAVLVFSSLSELRHMGEEQLRQRAQTTATLFATTAADAVLGSDLASLESFVNEVLKNPGLVYARVRDRQQTLAQQGNAAAMQRAFTADSRFADVDDGVFDTSAPIEIGGEVYGSVEIGLEIEHLQRELSRAKRTFSGIAFSEMLLTAVFSLVLGSLLTSQLRSLTAGTRAVGEGRFGFQIPTRGRDEIAQSVQAFNRMSSSLAGLMAENERQRNDLEANSNQLTTLLDNLHSAILMTDMRGVVVHVNQRFRALFKVPEQFGELVGRDYADLLRQIATAYADPRQIGMALQAIVDAGKPVHDRVFELVDGRLIETDYLPLLADGVQYAHLWDHRDVTERVVAQQQVHERRRQLDTVFDLSPDGFVYFDADGAVAFVNKAFTQMTGMTSEQAAGTPRHRFFPVMRVHCEITDIDDSEGFRLIRTSLPRPRVLSCRERKLQDADGNGTAHVMYFRDVTTERELDAVKNEFLTTAANELRSPLGRILVAAGAMLGRSDDDKERREALQLIHGEAAHLADMLDDLLSLAQIGTQAGRAFDIRQQPLLPLLGDALAPYLQGERHKHLEVHLPETLPSVPVDAVKFKQLIANLLDNAFKFSPDEGVVVTRVQVAGDDVVISVADQGIGMTQQEVAAVFEPFYRADSSRGRAGSGLGMSLVKEIVEVHGWRIGIDSVPGEGTAVSVAIPLRAVCNVSAPAAV